MFKFFKSLFSNSKEGFDILQSVMGAVMSGSADSFTDLFKKVFHLSKKHRADIEVMLEKGLQGLSSFIKDKEAERGNPIIMNLQRKGENLVVYLFDVKTENSRTFIDKKPCYTITDAMIVNNVLDIHAGSDDWQQFTKALPQVFNTEIESVVSTSEKE